MSVDAVRTAQPVFKMSRTTGSVTRQKFLKWAVKQWPVIKEDLHAESRAQIAEILEEEAKVHKWEEEHVVGRTYHAAGSAVIYYRHGHYALLEGPAKEVGCYGFTTVEGKTYFPSLENWCAWLGSSATITY
jgi:hypothetical protein